jgi:hypothetical protein
MSTERTNRYFLGARTKRHPQWATMLLPPRAPKNYKDQTKIAEAIKTKQGEQEAKADGSAHLAYPYEIALVDAAGGVTFNASNEAPDQLAGEFVQFIDDHRLLPELMYRPWFGFGIRELLQIIAMSAIRRQTWLEASNQVVEWAVPARLWYYPMFSQPPYVDPYTALVPSELRNDIDLAVLCREFNIPAEGHPETMNALQLAHLALDLTRKIGLDLVF